MTEEQVFLAALDLADPAERKAYLEKACSADAEFRRQVEELLAAHFKTGEFLDEPLGEQMGAGSSAPIDDNTMRMRAGPGEDVAPAAEKKSPEESDDLHFLQPSKRPDSLGRIGHYEVLEVLGKGGFGLVFRAFDETLQRVVALKVLAPAIAATSPARKRFLREARSSAQVRHENVVGVHAVEEQPLPYLVMDFIPGETLQQRLDRVGPLETPEIMRIGLQIAEGLAAAHATGLIHRDIKPGNILIEKGTQERVKITDFGLARAADDASLTQSGVLCGTPLYMAPEQARGETLDPRADLFSLGSVLYVMAAGRPPFRASTTFAVLKRVVEEEPRPIRDVIPEVPEYLCEIIAKLQAKKPEDRFPTAQEVADLLKSCQAEMQRGRVPTIKNQSAAVKKMPPPRETPQAAPATRRLYSRTGRWTAAVLLLLLGGLVVTEAIGVSDFRGTIIRLASPRGAPLVENEAPPDRTKLPPPPRLSAAKEKVSKPIAPPATTIHDAWIKAVALLPQDQQGEAVAARMKEQLPGFDKALLKAIPVMSADRQAIMVDVWLTGRNPAFAGLEDAWLKAIPALSANAQAVVADAWLKERKPAFAGFEDAWLKAIPVLAVDTQVVLLAAWLKERNPTFDGSMTPKTEGNVIVSLEVPSPRVQDLLPLRALTGLKTLRCRSTVGWDNKAESDAAVLDSLKALEKINGKSVAQFRKDVAAKKADFKEWLNLVPSLTAKQQVAAVAARIKEHNPEFDGRVRDKIEDGVVTEIVIYGAVSDLSPLRALIGLRSLWCDQKSEGALSDLSPLKDMKLTSLTLRFMPATDLAPLKDMKLTSLSLNGTPVTDLSPLKDNTTILTLTLVGSPVSDLSPLKDNRTLTTLNLSKTRVADLSPLKNTLLTSLYFGHTRVEDLSPLKDLKLTSLDIHVTLVSDLSPLKGMPLAELNCKNSKVTDLSPLKDLPLTKIECDFQPERDTTILRAVKTLNTINGKSAAEFWKGLEKQ